jgi:hypothetical protein
MAKASVADDAAECVGGDKLFVDWAGGTLPIIEPMTDEV